jgi:plastocyanin
MAVHSIVTDNMGKPLKNAVVYAMPTERMAPTKDWETVIFVENNEFQPFVLPVRTGAAVTFMNTDRVQHHIYSVSPVINFDLPLDKAEPSKPIALNKAGVVVLGCAIHDRMVGYLYVMETAYFAKTGEEGRADLSDLPRGAYNVLVWHPWMKGSPEETAKRISSNAQSIATVDFVFTLQIKNNPASSPKHRGE